ncbi:MAG: hypothetical protein QG608_1744, partial [Actinomycetota bacterium]|nr:hypothetical protein [Actinomycetota bacterium]
LALWGVLVGADRNHYRPLLRPSRALNRTTHSTDRIPKQTLDVPEIPGPIGCSSRQSPSFLPSGVMNTR